MRRKNRFCFPSKYSRKGVSDVVGNIILLAVTVMMFSAILVYSMNLPKPQTQSHIRFNASLILTENGKANITITHTGGDNIKVSNVRIVVYVDGKVETIRLSSSSGWENLEYWNTGLSWKYTTNTQVSISSVVSVVVIDDIENKVIFSSTLLGGSSNLPPMILKIFSTPEPILIGKNYQFFAIVWDPDGNLDPDSVYINITNLYGDGNIRIVQMMRVKDDLFATNATNLATSLSLPFDKSLKGEKTVRVNATDRLGLPSSINCSVIIGEESELIGVADPSIADTDIAFSSPSVIQGDYITLYAKVTNSGTLGTNVTVQFSYEISGLKVPIGNGTDIYGNTTQYIRGNFDIKIFQITWRPLGPGMHNISAEVFVNTSMHGSALDINLSNNKGVKALGVIPRILIVDDDQYPGDGSNRDSVGFMKSALTACGFKWEYTTVRANMDGPLLSYGDYKLEDYGIVIWMCGYQTTSTLTPTDRQTIQDYLARRDCSLWLIGQDILNDLSSTGGTTFIQNTLHVSSYTLDERIPYRINGTPGHFISNGLSYVTRQFLDPADNADIIVPDSDAKGLMQNSSKTGPNNYSLTYEDTTKNSKLCLFTYEFSRLQRLDDMAQLAYKIILWLGNLQTRYGNDLAISEQNISNQYPFFAEIININATIRNNGDEDLPNSNIPYIRVQFLLDDTEIIGELLITDVIQKGGLEISSKTVNISWKADRLGHHTIVAVVDPLMEIDEVNEENNRISAGYKTELAMIDVYVRFNVLIVDDDGSKNNDGVETNNKLNATANITAILDSLNYAYANFTVNATSNWNGPSYENLTQYNLVIWCTGESPASTLTDEDKTNISKYLDNMGQFWLIGQNLLDDFPNGEVSDSFFRNYMKVSGVTHYSASNVRLLSGIQGDPVTHGLVGRLEKSSLFTSAEGADGLAVNTTAGASGIFVPSSTVDVEFESGFEEGFALFDDAYWGITTWPPVSNSNIGRIYESRNAAHGGQKGAMMETIDVSSNNVSNFVVKNVDYDECYVRGYFKWDVNPSNGQIVKLMRVQGEGYWANGHVATVAIENAGGSLRAALIYRSNAGTPDSKLTYNYPFVPNRWYCIELHTKIGDAANGLVELYIDGQSVLSVNVDNNDIGGLGLIKKVYIGSMGVSYKMNLSLDDVKIGEEGPIGPDSFFGLRYYDSIYHYRILFLPFELAFLGSQSNNNETLREFVYLAMHWFNTPDSRVELRVTNIDLFYSTTRVTMAPLRQLVPMLGSTYILQAKIWNVGGSRGDAVVRFMDGTAVIGSPSISVDKDKVGIAEVVWTPTRAGDRLISIFIDPMDNLPEIRDIESSQGEVFNFNNNVSGRVRLYFFYDDMESGTGNWKHDTTLVNINGESAIDFLGPGEAETEVITGWESTFGLSETRTEYHSVNKSYVMNLNPVTDFVYEFYLPNDGMGNWQSAYIVGVVHDSNYVVRRWDATNCVWEEEESGIIGLGKIKLIRSGGILPSRTIYKVNSDGPLLIVVTSKEGSNVNIANYENGTGVGKNFVVIGDIAGKVSGDSTTGNVGSRIVVFALEDSTTVYCNFTNLTTYQLLSSSPPKTLNAGQFDYFQHVRTDTATVVANISSNKPIIAYRISGDNDELDTAMSTSGYSLGTEHYFPIAGSSYSRYARVVFTNPSDYEATVTIRELQSNPSPLLSPNPRTVNVAAHQTYAISFDCAQSTESKTIRYYKVTSTQPIMVTYGAKLSSQNWYNSSYYSGGNTWGVDAIWEWLPVRTVDGQYQYKMPIVYGDNAYRYQYISYMYQHIITASQTTTDFTPSIAFLDSTTTQNSFRYNSTTDCTLKINIISGTPSITWRLDSNSYQSLTGLAVSLPAGAHNLSLKISGSGRVGIAGIDISSEGSIVWNLLTLATDGTKDHANTDLTDNPPFWTVTSSKRILFLVGGDGNCWIHTILPFEGQVSSGEVVTRGSRGAASTDYYAITKTFSLEGYSKAELSFYHKYNIQLGANGVVILVGNDTNGDNVFKYKYVTPRQAYTGNIRFENWGPRIYDNFGNEMRWCFNGVSSNGRYDWDYISVDISEFVGRPHVRVKFLYLNVTNTLPGKWYVDDIVVKATRSDSLPVTSSTADNWELTTEDAYSGSYSWWCHDVPSSNGLKGGIDNSLYTRAIDLTSARNASLEAKVKFNINSEAGRPPDSLRVEVSSDAGITWYSLTLGVRACWGVSGTESDISDGVLDGKSYTGIGTDETHPGWVNVGTLTRVSCDLSGWAGKVIMLRFRIVTNKAFTNYESPNAPMGVFIDDVAVVGNSSSGRESEELSYDEIAKLPSLTKDPYPENPNSKPKSESRNSENEDVSVLTVQNTANPNSINSLDLKPFLIFWNMNGLVVMNEANDVSVDILDDMNAGLDVWGVFAYLFASEYLEDWYSYLQMYVGVKT